MWTFENTLVISHALWLAKRLRVTDSRSGARLCEPQQNGWFEDISIHCSTALKSEAAAGRRPAVLSLGARLFKPAAG